MTGAFDANRQLSLMRRAGSRDTAGQNLAALRNKTAKLANVLVIYMAQFIGAKRAYAFFLAAASFLYHAVVPPLASSPNGKFSQKFTISEIEILNRLLKRQVIVIQTFSNG